MAHVSQMLLIEQTDLHSREAVNSVKQNVEESFLLWYLIPQPPVHTDTHKAHSGTTFQTIDQMLFSN